MDHRVYWIDDPFCLMPFVFTGPCRISVTQAASDNRSKAAWRLVAAEAFRGVLFCFRYSQVFDVLHPPCICQACGFSLGFSRLREP